MTIAELDLSVTTSSQSITALATFVPQGVNYVQFINNSATASITYSLNTPATNGVGVTVLAGGSSTISCPSGIIFPLASVKLIGSGAANVTVLYS